MANLAMFGAPVGAQIAKEERRAAELHELSLDKGEVELEKAKMELNSQKMMLEMMSQPKNPEGDSDKNFSMAEKMDTLAEIALASGLPEKAKDYATAGSTLRKNTDEIDKRRLESRLKGLELLSSLVDRVIDERSWRKAMATFKEATGQEPPFAGQPYDPSTVQQIKMSVLDAKDKASIEASKARVSASEAMEAERRARLPLIKAQTDLAKAREKKLEKAGDTKKIPKAEDIRAISDLIVRDYRATMPEDARALARPVAERMIQLMEENQISKSQAAMRAFQEAKAGGHFGGLRVSKAQPGTRDNPMDMPEDFSKLKPNRFYKGKGKYKGKPILWTGSAFQDVEEFNPSQTEEEDIMDEEDLEALEEEAEE
jgi:hypothetical protein